LPEEKGSEQRVGLFVTCLVDLMRPSVGFAAVKLLEDAGCKVIVPSQTCCGQPAYNSGDRADAKRIARATLRATLSRIVPRRTRGGARGGRFRRQMPGAY
jgi:L-lactate dehydrogenase complex protein LldE